MDRVEELLRGIDVAALQGLEIGALAAPIRDGKMVPCSMSIMLMRNNFARNMQIILTLIVAPSLMSTSSGAVMDLWLNF